MSWAHQGNKSAEQTKEEADHENFGTFVASGELSEMRKRLVGEVYARIGEKRKQKEQNDQGYTYTFEIGDRTDPENYQVFDCLQGIWLKLDKVQPFFKQELLDRKKKVEQAIREAKRERTRMNPDEFKEFMRRHMGGAFGGFTFHYDI